MIDHLNTLNHLTPKIQCQGRNGVDPKFIFGVDSKLFLDPTAQESLSTAHHDEVETITLYSGRPSGRPHTHSHLHHEREADEDEVSAQESDDDLGVIDRTVLIEALSGLSKESVWRVKGFVRFTEGVHILNWAFGRFELTQVDEGARNAGAVKLTVMGERGEVKRASRKFAAALGADIL